jgi:hypothetical protein
MRLPMNDATIKQLKAASKECGISASRLLFAALALTMKEAQMKALEEDAADVFHRLMKGLRKIGDSRELNGHKAIPIHVEVIDINGYGSLVSVSHCFDCKNGKLKDPEVIFLVDAEKKVFPLSYKQENFGTEFTAAFMENGRWVVRPKLQEAMTDFCQDWMLNIFRQLD